MSTFHFASMNFFMFGDKQRIRTHNLLQFMNQQSSV